MTRKQIIMDRLEAAFRASRYHSFVSSLKGTSDDGSRWTPPHYRGFPHMDGSILNLAYHTAGDKHVLLRLTVSGEVLVEVAEPAMFAIAA